MRGASTTDPPASFLLNRGGLRHGQSNPIGIEYREGMGRVVLTDCIDLLHDAFWRSVGLEAHRFIVAKSRRVISADIGVDFL